MRSGGGVVNDNFLVIGGVAGSFGKMFHVKQNRPGNILVDIIGAGWVWGLRSGFLFYLFGGKESGIGLRFGKREYLNPKPQTLNPRHASSWQVVEIGWFLPLD